MNCIFNPFTPNTQFCYFKHHIFQLIFFCTCVILELLKGQACFCYYY